MRVLVLGCMGMAGHVISLYLQERGYDVTGFARQRFPVLKNSISGDAADFPLIKNILVEGKYDAVVNCIAILNKYTEIDKANAILINSYLPHYLVDVTKNMSTRVIHMSTESVFCGNTGPYFEDSRVCPASFYGLTKALGEFCNKKDIVLRNSVIGPDYRSDGPSLFNWFMAQKGSLTGYNGAIWTGLSTPTLARAIDAILKTDLYGIYNLVNNDNISKYELLQLFNKYFRDGKLRISSNSDLKLDMSLRSKRTDFDFVVPSYENQIVEMKGWIENHRELYSHYY